MDGLGNSVEHGYSQKEIVDQVALFIFGPGGRGGGLGTTKDDNKCERERKRGRKKEREKERGSKRQRKKEIMINTDSVPIVLQPV